MISTIPLMPLPYKTARPLIHGVYPIAAIVEKLFPALGRELEEAGSELESRDYVAGALLSFALYFFAIFTLLNVMLYRNELIGDFKARMVAFLVSLFISLMIFSYVMLIPRWMYNKKKLELEKNLLFAVRHLMIQTSAGVPLFESIVSVSEECEDERMNYGQVGVEFRKIVKEVKGGKELTRALEESAESNPSSYYKRVVWQLANANNAGVNLNYMLREIVEFLSNEQRIMIRNYGSQLSPLSMFYMLVCIIVPTTGLIFLAIASSFVAIQLNEYTLATMLVFLTIVQIMFIGLIKGRRPPVVL